MGTASSAEFALCQVVATAHCLWTCARETRCAFHLMNVQVSLSDPEWVVDAKTGVYRTATATHATLSYLPLPPPNFFYGAAFPGAARVFEMQLMPALLLELQVNAFADEETGGTGSKPRPDTKGHSNAEEAAGNKATAKPSVVDQTERPSPEPTGKHIDSLKGVARKPGSDEGEGVAMGEHSDGDSKPMVLTPSAEERDRLRTWGMDWGVVAVWTCPRSCEASCEEYVTVQMPV